MEPLDLRAKIAKNFEGFLRGGLSLIESHLPGARDFPFNDKLRHGTILSFRRDVENW